jgi:hypothetical protein
MTIKRVLTLGVTLGVVLCFASTGLAKHKAKASNSSAYQDLATENKEHRWRGTPCLSLFFTISDGPHGVFECNGNDGLALCGLDTSGEEFARRAPLRFDRYATIAGLQGWIYEEQDGSGRLWFFSVPSNPHGLSQQYWNFGAGWNGPITLRAVPIRPDYRKTDKRASK